MHRREVVLNVSVGLAVVLFIAGVVYGLYWMGFDPDNPFHMLGVFAVGLLAGEIGTDDHDDFPGGP